MKTRRFHRLNWQKRIVFTLVTTLIFFSGTTFILRSLETLGFLSFSRPDDRVTQGSLSSLNIRRTWHGDVFSINAGNMVWTEFPVKKPRNGFRIAVTGGSFAMGSPYNLQRDWAQRHPTEFGSIPDWLRAELPLRYPSVHFEVINAAAGALNSQGALLMVEELVRIKPDMIIVACSDNEGYVSVTDFNEPLSRWALYRALRKGLTPNFKPSERSYFAPQDPDNRRITKEFQDNFRSIVEICRENRITPVLVASPINLMFRGGDPRVHGKVLELPVDDPHLARGGKFFLEGRYEEAIEEYLNLPAQGWAAKFVGDCLFRLGRYEEAKEFYKIYVEELPMNRTRPSFNRFLRDLAQERNLVFIDMEKAAEDISPNGITSPKLYLDYCHMTWMGYYAMAQEAIRVLIASGQIPASLGEPLAAPTLDELIEHQGAQGLYTDKGWKWSPGKTLYGLDTVVN